jgi:hypothetical protein
MHTVAICVKCGEIERHEIGKEDNADQHTGEDTNGDGERPRPASASGVERDGGSQKGRFIASIATDVSRSSVR